VKETRKADLFTSRKPTIGFKQPEMRRGERGIFGTRCYLATAPMQQHLAQYYSRRHCGVVYRASDWSFRRKGGRESCGTIAWWGCHAKTRYRSRKIVSFDCVSFDLCWQSGGVL